MGGFYHVKLSWFLATLHINDVCLDLEMLRCPILKMLRCPMAPPCLTKGSIACSAPRTSMFFNALVNAAGVADWEINAFKSLQSTSTPMMLLLSAHPACARMYSAEDQSIVLAHGRSGRCPAAQSRAVRTAVPG